MTLIWSSPSSSAELSSEKPRASPLPLSALESQIRMGTRVNLTFANNFVLMLASFMYEVVQFAKGRGQN